MIEETEAQKRELLRFYLDQTDSLPPLAQRRKELKLRLYWERAIDLRGPSCPICGRTVLNDGDMHEVLLTRGMVQKAPPEAQAEIFVSENCVLLHHGPCHIEAQTQQGKIKCVRQLLEFEGYAHICLWLDHMIDLFNGNLHEEYSLVREINWRLHQTEISLDYGPRRVQWRFEK